MNNGDLATMDVPGLMVVDCGRFVPWDGMTPAARSRWLSRAGAARRAAVALGMALNERPERLWPVKVPT